MTQNRGDSVKRLRQPNVLQAAKFGLGVGTAYAIAGSVFVLLTGGIPESWGDATMSRVILVEIIGGAVGGTLVGLLSSLARFWLGAVLVTSIGLSPLVVGAAVLVDGPSWSNMRIALMASLLIGLIVGHNLWRNDSRYWGSGDSSAE